MYLSIGRASRLLGVTPATVRHWTETGLLPCTRTVGGHRRFLREDVLRLAGAVADGGDLAARAAREREVETLTKASIAVASHLDQADVLAEIARHTTSLCRCHLCEIDVYDPGEQVLRAMAEYDRSGPRRLEVEYFHLSDYPFTRKVLEAQVTEVVNADDPAADEAEVALMRRHGVSSTLLMPLVYQGRSIGLLTAMDRERSRRYSAQELRLCSALAGHAAVALRNAELYRRACHADADMETLRRMMRALAAMIDASVELPAAIASLPALSEAIRSAFGASSCVLTHDGRTVGASATNIDRRTPGRHTVCHQEDASLLQAAHDSDLGRLEITLTLPVASGPGQPELLDLVTSLAAKMVRP